MIGVFVSVEMGNSEKQTSGILQLHFLIFISSFDLGATTADGAVIHVLMLTSRVVIFFPIARCCLLSP